MNSILSKLAVLQLLFMLLIGSLLYVLSERDTAVGLRQAFTSAGQAVALRTTRVFKPALLAKHNPATLQPLLIQQRAARKFEWAYLVSPDGEVLAHTFTNGLPRDLLLNRNPGDSNWYDLTRPREALTLTVCSQ